MTRGNSHVCVYSITSLHVHGNSLTEFGNRVPLSYARIGDGAKTASTRRNLHTTPSTSAPSSSMVTIRSGNHGRPFESRSSFGWLYSAGTGPVIGAPAMGSAPGTIVPYATRRLRASTTYSRNAHTREKSGSTSTRRLAEPCHRHRMRSYPSGGACERRGVVTREPAWTRSSH